MAVWRGVHACLVRNEVMGSDLEKQIMTCMRRKVEHILFLLLLFFLFCFFYIFF